MLLKALADLGAVPGAGLVVGDSKSDIGSARAAGCPVIAVSYGYPHGPVADLGADAVIDTMPDLLGHIALPRSTS
jgi:phosphoglycolate phosphatase